MSSTSMASSSEFSTDSAIQASMAPQRSTVHDLYGLVGVETPNATETQIRKSYEAMVKKLLPKGPSNAAKAAFSVLTNPATRAQYDRDRLGYLYAQFKCYELFPTKAPLEKNKYREDQIEVYAAVLKDHISDPVEDKKVKIHARLFQIRNELDEYKENSKNVQEEWATSSNQILRMSANALREVEICARADIEMLENELGDLRGQLPPKNTDGPPGRIASGQYGSDMGVHAKNKSLLAVNQRAPSIPRSPTLPVRLRSASKFGVRMENSSTGDSSSSTSRSESTMAIDDRIQKYLVGSVYSPTFYAPATYLDAGKRQHDVERIIARAKRQSLDPETLSDLGMVKSEKLLKPGDKNAVAGFDPVAFPESDSSIKQNKTSHTLYGDLKKKDETNQRLANIGEISEHQVAQCEGETLIANNGPAQMSAISESDSSTTFPSQSPPGLGLVEYQQRFGCHVITEDKQEKQKEEEAVATSSKKSVSSKNKFRQPWISINDSVSMPAHLSSIRADRHACVTSMNMTDVDSPVDRPDRPFQRTTRGLPSTESTPMEKLRTKPALSSTSNELMQQELKVAQPMPRKPSQVRDCTAIIQSVQEAVWEKAQVTPTAAKSKDFQAPQDKSCKEIEGGNNVSVTQEAQYVEIQEQTMDTQEDLERSVSRMQKEEAARTLVELSRHRDDVRGTQHQAAPSIDNGILYEYTQQNILPQIGGQQVGGPHGVPGYGVPEYDLGAQQSSRLFYHMPNYAQQYGSTQQPGGMYPMGPPNIGSMIPTIHYHGFQEGYHTGNYLREPHIEHAYPYGAIGSEMKAMKEEKAQEKVVARDVKAHDEEKATLDEAAEASKLSRNLTVSHKGTEDPFDK